MSTPAGPVGAELWLWPEPLLLASRSRARAAMLASAAIPFEMLPAAVDERAVEAGLVPGQGIAEALACAKALAVSRDRPGRLVLGADQTMSLDGEPLHKPADREDAARQLARMAGRSHLLVSAAALARDGTVLDTVSAEATIRLRPLSEAMIRLYLAAAGDGVLDCVGAYEIEALGVHLFEAVDGDHYTVMGLPLLPLLGVLRRHGALAD